MANKTMKTLTLGEDIYEIVDAAARSNIKTLKADMANIDYPVDSVNGKTGAVTLTASDVGALPDTTVIPSTEGLAAASQASTLTVSASAWAGDEAPYIAKIDCVYATADNHLIVGAGGALTAEQQTAMTEAMIVCTAQAVGSITLTAFGKKPEIDLPVNVLVVG